MASGREKELATTSLEFEYLHRKSQCEMLIGGDDISNDVMSIGTCFLMFVYIRARFLRADWRGATGEVGVEFKFRRRRWKLSFLFPPRRQSARRACLQDIHIIMTNNNTDCLLRLIAAIYRMAELESYLQNI